MQQNTNYYKTFATSLTAVALGLVGYHYVVNKPSQHPLSVVSTDPILSEYSYQNESSPITQVAYKKNNFLYNSGVGNMDFTNAANSTIDAVVHVKQYSTRRKPMNIFDFLNNTGKLERRVEGAGSGVIVSKEGYIVTNYHVIQGASALEVSLNNNVSYKASVVGVDQKSDIALLKIEPETDLTYIPFGDSNTAKIGEWVLAVGNPFNLTSTVTAGIISAKSRDLDETDANSQSFIQTDAAINPGNSGGALVNTKGELIGINTAITSQTGSYIGYAFAVPSNNVRKIVQDLLEYGNVQKPIMGISGNSLDGKLRKAYNISTIEGVLVAYVGEDTPAQKAGIQPSDVITGIDGIKVTKFADLTGYVNTKNPGDMVHIKLERQGKENFVDVILKHHDSFIISGIGIEVENASKSYLGNFGLSQGVVIRSVTNSKMKDYQLEGLIITAVDGVHVSTVQQVREVMQNRATDRDLSVSFVDQSKVEREFIFRG